jgi:hypothetical protein
MPAPIPPPTDSTPNLADVHARFAQSWDAASTPPPGIEQVARPTAVGEFGATMLMAAAQLEPDLISVRTREGLAAGPRDRARSSKIAPAPHYRARDNTASASEWTRTPVPALGTVG